MTDRSSAELRKYIIERLSEAEDPNDLILDICNQTGMKWPEVETLVNRIRTVEQGEIIRKQSPLLIAVALTMFTGGIGILGYEAFLFMTLVVGYMRISRDPLVLFDLANYVPNYVVPFFEVTPFALAMILGSLLGMRQVWSSILFRGKPSD